MTEQTSHCCWPQIPQDWKYSIKWDQAPNWRSEHKKIEQFLTKKSFQFSIPKSPSSPFQIIYVHSKNPSQTQPRQPKKLETKNHENRQTLPLLLLLLHHLFKCSNSRKHYRLQLHHKPDHKPMRNLCLLPSLGSEFSWSCLHRRPLLSQQAHDIRT